MADRPQGRLFFDSLLDALRDVVQQLGGAKVVGPMLWPEKSVEQAQVLLLACLNSERKERLSPEQLELVLRWGREAGCHSGIAYLCDRCGYAAPTPVDPQDAMAARIDEFNRRAAELTALGEEIKRCGGLGALKAVR